MINAKAERWRQMAEECRVCAESMHSGSARCGMMHCAAGYDLMAAQAEHAPEQSILDTSPEVWSPPIAG